MKRRNFFILLLSLLLVTVLAFALFACDKTPDQEGEQQTETGDNPSGGNQSGGNPSGGQTTDPDVDKSIDVPTGLAITNGKASWKRVSGATFELEINGAVLDVGNAVNYNLSDYTPLPSDGVFTLRVRAVKGGKKSEWSDSVSYSYVAVEIVNPSVTGLSGTTMQWTASPNALYPLITIAGAEHKLDASATSYDLAGVTAKSDVTLTYVADGVYYKNSATVRLVYDPAANRLSYAAPTNVYMDGEVLHFDKVEGANIYYFLDVRHTVTSISGEAINALSSDRKGHELIQSMWAGNTDLDIGNSEPTEVTYFVSKEGASVIPHGAGTEADPFLISSVGDMRYIEYCEAINRSYFYQLTNDIVFEAYSPKKDEEYSNFYNLGSFSGVLNGNGYAWKNVVVYYKDGYSSIFDNVTESGVIKNLKIENTDWRTWTVRTNDGTMHQKGGECAVLSYKNRGTIDNVTLVSGSVCAVRDGAAGLVSENHGVIRNCTVQEGFTVYGANEAGSIAIYNVGTIEGCLNYGTVSGVKTIGGIVGRNAGTVTRCGNYGSVSGDDTVGGIVGYNYNIQDIDDAMQFTTLVSECANRGDVYAFRTAGGIVGRNGSTGVNEVGLVRYGNAGVYGCYNRGDVTGAMSVGGIAGENNAYAQSGRLSSGETYRFGLIACYSSGDVIKANGHSLYFVDSKGWGNIYAYAWNDTTQENDGAWPGNACFYVGKNEFDQDIYSIVIPQDCNMAIFNSNGSGDNKTGDIALSAYSSGFYVNDDGSVGTFDYSGTPTLGYLTGYNNAIGYCYYAVVTAGYTVTIGGSAGSTEQMTADSDKKKIADKLNEALGYDAFVVEDNKYPVLAWELEN